MSESRHGPPASESALGRGPASSVPCPASPVPLTWVGLAAFGRKLSEWGKKLLTAADGEVFFLAILFCLFTGSF